MYELIEAIVKDDHDKTDKLIKSNPELVLKLTEEEGITFVALAAGKGNAELVSRLIELGAPFKAPLTIGPLQKFTPLIVAILCQHIEVIKVLIKCGANLNNEVNRSEIHTKKMDSKIYSIVKPFMDTVELIDDKVPNKEQTTKNIKDNQEKVMFSLRTPLFYAVNTQNLEIIKLLLDNGVHPLHETAEHLNPFFYVIDRKFAKTGELMARYIENPNQTLENGKMFTGITPFYIAAYHGVSNVVKYFIDKGAKVDEILTKGVYQGYSPVFSAACFGHYDTVELLIDAGADIHHAIKRKNEECTPLITAICHGYFDMVKLLIEKGKVDYQSPMMEGDSYLGTTPLHHAISVGNLEIVKYLIAKGCDVNEVVKVGSFNGDVPLCFAIREEQREIIFLLLENGADFKKALIHDTKKFPAYFFLNQLVYSPLYKLYQQGYLDIAEKLLKEDKHLYA